MAAHLRTSGGKLERESRIKKVYVNHRKRRHGGHMKTGNGHSAGTVNSFRGESYVIQS